MRCCLAWVFVEEWVELWLPIGVVNDFVDLCSGRDSVDDGETDVLPVSERVGERDFVLLTRSLRVTE